MDREVKLYSHLGIIEGNRLDDKYKRVQVRGVMRSWTKDGIELSLGEGKEASQ